MVRWRRLGGAVAQQVQYGARGCPSLATRTLPARGGERAHGRDNRGVVHGHSSHVVALTIGHTPRPDLVGTFRSLLPSCTLHQAGALDGLGADAVAAFGDVADPSCQLITKLVDGTQVTVSEALVKVLLQSKLDAWGAQMDESGASSSASSSTSGNTGRGSGSGSGCDEAAAPACNGGAAHTRGSLPRIENIAASIIMCELKHAICRECVRATKAQLRLWPACPTRARR